MRILPRNPYLVADKARQMHHEVLCAALHGGMSYEDAMRAANDRYGEWLKATEARDEIEWERYRRDWEEYENSNTSTNT